MPCTEEDIIVSDLVDYKEIELTSDSILPHIKDMREGVIKSVLEDINSYFPEGSLRMFSIFDPKMIPMSLGQADNVDDDFYGTEEIKQLAERFGVDKTAAVSDWRILLEAIV